MTEKFAVIGSNSFSGSHFINYLLENTNQSVIGISRSSEYDPIFLPYKRHGDKNFKFYQGDLNNDLETIMNILKKEEVTKVINFSAQGMVGQSWENPIHWYKTNTLSVIDLAERLKKFPNLKKYLQISTPEIYGSCDNIQEDAIPNPSSPYANSKLAADTHLKLMQKQFNFPVVFARSTNVYGPGQQLYRIIPISIIKIKKREKIKLQGGGKAIKSYMHIRDVCAGYFKILDNGRLGEVYHLSPDAGNSIESIIKIICKKSNIRFEQAVDIIEERKGQDAKYVINSDKARKELNWCPRISIEEGIDECISWVNKNWEKVKDLPLEYVHKI